MTFIQWGRTRVSWISLNSRYSMIYDSIEESLICTDIQPHSSNNYWRWFLEILVITDVMPSSKFDGGYRVQNLGISEQSWTNWILRPRSCGLSADRPSNFATSVTKFEMADDELAAIRAARLKELQEQSTGVCYIRGLSADYKAKQCRRWFWWRRSYAEVITDIYLMLTFRQKEDEARHTIVASLLLPAESL